MRPSPVTIVLLSWAYSTGCHALPLGVTVGDAFAPRSQQDRIVSVEVFVSGGVSDTPPLVAHQLQLTLDARGAGVRMSGAGAPQGHPYLGPSPEPAVSLAPGGLVVDSGDITFGPGVSPVVGAGLLRVEIIVPVNTPLGVYPLTVSEDSALTSFTGDDFAPLPLELTPGSVWVVLPGDYNLDNEVNTLDHTLWHQRYGSTGVDSADGNLDGVVDAADYTVWRDNEGQTASTLANDIDGGVIGKAQHNTWVSKYGKPASTANAVPEPATVAWITLGFFGLTSRCRQQS